MFIVIFTLCLFMSITICTTFNKGSAIVMLTFFHNYLFFLKLFPK
nr:MAG TPA: hypothetical protein [Caudoviricetes sp.]